MFDKYIIAESGFRNVEVDGEVVGFQLGVRLPYYRGLALSMVESIDVVVDGEPVGRDDITLTVGDRTFTQDEMESSDHRWEMGDVATVTVDRSGGLAPGDHVITIAERLRISYLPFPGGGRDHKVLALESGVR